MTAEILFSQGLAVAIIIALAWFGWRELWPFLRDRDQQRRDRDHELEQRRHEADQTERDRRHELERRQIETDGLMASALTVLADAVRSCPVNVAVTDDSQVIASRLANT